MPADKKKRGGTQRSNAKRYCGAPNEKYFFVVCYSFLLTVMMGYYIGREKYIYSIMKLLLLLKIGYYFFLFFMKGLLLVRHLLE